MADLLYARRIKIYFYVLDEYVESSPWPKWYGTTHSDDIAFVFGHTLTDRTNGFISLNPWAEYKSYSNEVINFTHKILSYWSNFAKKSDPNQNGLPHWEVYDLTYNMTMHPKRSSHNLQKKWLLLKKNDIKMTNENYGEHCSFWNDRSRYLRDVRPRYLQTTKRYSLVQY
ncbi:unnamed protein product [Brachionus calyciflorus]|nr:unnamed protein product [Brachionus calyciflorus]